MQTLAEQHPLRVIGDQRPRYLDIRDGNRELLVIEADGSVTGEIENAGQAAAIFVQEIRRLLAWD